MGDAINLFLHSISSSPLTPFGRAVSGGTSKTMRPRTLLAPLGPGSTPTASTSLTFLPGVPTSTPSRICGTTSSAAFMPIFAGLSNQMLSLYGGESKQHKAGLLALLAKLCTRSSSGTSGTSGTSGKFRSHRDASGCSSRFQPEPCGGNRCELRRGDQRGAAGTVEQEDTAKLPLSCTTRCRCVPSGPSLAEKLIT